MQAITASSRTLAPLHRLNRAARTHARTFNHDPGDWSQTVDRAKPWEPEGLGALGFLSRSLALLAEYREHERLWNNFPLAPSERS